MALETMTSIAMCKFIPCGADATSSAKPSSWSREKLSEEAAVIEEAVGAGKETTASTQPRTDSRILTKASQVSVSAGSPTRNEKTADEDREERKEKRTQAKEKQGKEKAAGGHGTGVRETTRVSYVPKFLNEALSDKQGTATSPESEFVPEDWWIEMACDYWEMDKKEVLKIVFRATDRDVTYDKAVNQQVSGGLFEPNETTPTYLCGPTEPLSPAVCDQTNGLSSAEYSGQNHELTTIPCRGISDRRLKVKIAQAGRLPTIAEEPSESPETGKINRKENKKRKAKKRKTSRSSKNASASTFPDSRTRNIGTTIAAAKDQGEQLERNSAPTCTLVDWPVGNSETNREVPTAAAASPEVLSEAPSDKQGAASHPEPEFVPEDWWIEMACDYWEMDEKEVLKIVSTLQKTNNLAATQDLEVSDNGVGGMRKQSPTDLKAELSVGTELLDLNCTKNGELQPFQFQPGERKAREHNPSPNWESSTSSKTSGSLQIPPLGATSGRLVQPACQPHPPSLPAPEGRKNPRARRFVKPVARDQRSLKELAHRVGEDDSRLPDVNFSGGRAMSPTKTDQGKPGAYNGNAAKETPLGRQKRRPHPRQQTQEPKFLLPLPEGLAGISKEKICCRLNAVPNTGKVNIVPITSGHL